MSVEEDKKREHIQKLVDKLNQNNRQLDVLLELSANLVDVGDLEQAEELLTRSLSLFPNNLDLIYNLANVYYLAEKYDRANELLDKLITKDYGFEAYYMKAKTLNGQGNKSMAIVYALTAVEKNGEDLGTIELLADLLMANGNFDTATTYYQKANSIEPKSKFYFNLAVCAMNLEQPFQEFLNESKRLDEKYYLEHEKKLADLQKFMTENGGKND